MIVLRLFIFCMYQEIIMLEVHANKSDIIKGTMHEKEQVL